MYSFISCHNVKLVHCQVSTPSKGTGSTKGTQVFDSMTRKKSEKTTPVLVAPTGKSKSNSKTVCSSHFIIVLQMILVITCDPNTNFSYKSHCQSLTSQVCIPVGQIMVRKFVSLLARSRWFSLCTLESQQSLTSQPHYK